MHLCPRYKCRAKVSISFLLKLRGSTSYGLTSTASHQFCVLALQEAAQAGCNHPYEQPPLTNHGSCPETPPRGNNTHIAFACPTAPHSPAPCSPDCGRRGGEGWHQKMTHCPEALSKQRKSLNLYRYKCCVCVGGGGGGGGCSTGV